MWRVHIRALIRTGLIALSLFSMAAHADPYAYNLRISPDDEHLDPKIERLYTLAFRNCARQATSHPDEAKCFESEFSRQDRMLNSIWGTSIKRKSGTDREQLVSAQRKWASQQDTFCNNESGKFRQMGTLVMVVYWHCRTELTIRRAAWLKKFGQ